MAEEMSEEPLTEEELQAFAASREEEQQALALMASAQRTLRDSRARPAQARLSRNNWPPVKGPQARLPPS